MRDLKLRYLFFICICLMSISGQGKIEDTNVFSLIPSITGSTEQVPLWLSSKQWGTVQEVPFQISLNCLFHNSWNVFHNGLLEFGTRALLTGSEESEAQVNELYFQFIYYPFYLYAGKKREIIGQATSELSSGSMVISDNAQPMPKISAGLIDFVTIPYTFDIFQIKGHIAHGWFQQDRYIKDILLHEKDVYIRLNTHIGIFPYVGLVHEAMWGGIYPDGTKVCDTNWDNFWRVFNIDEGGEDSPVSDQENKIGNHLGIWDVGFYFSFPNFSGQLYYQHYFEDNSGYRDYQNGTDGLWGIDVMFDNGSFIDEVLYEYLDTTHQSGNVPHTKGGRDNYYMHGIYKSGWTYKNRILGNSFFGVTGEGEDLRVDSNRIVAHHLGVKGHFNSLWKWKTLISRAEYHPTYSNISRVEEEEWMWHLYGEIEKNNFFGYSDLHAGFGMGYDFGSLQDALGAKIFIAWQY